MRRLRVKSSLNRLHSISDEAEGGQHPAVQPGANRPETPALESSLGAHLTALEGQELPNAAGPVQVQLAQLHVWEGQFPPPETVERYEKIQPGAFDRIIAMAEAAQRAHWADTKRAHDYAQADTRRGQWLGAATTWLAIGAALGCIVFARNSWAAVAFLSVPVMAVAKSLIESAKSPSTSHPPDSASWPSDSVVPTPEDRQPN
jgi:uncharacterized membrane protein